MRKAQYAIIVTLLALTGGVVAVKSVQGQDHKIPTPVHAPVFAQDIKLPDCELAPEKVSTPNQSGERRDWGHTNLKLADAQKLATGKGVLVAVLDTGIDQDHPDLKGAVVEGKDFTNSRSGAADVQGHGTHCAGIIGARLNDKGVVGAAYDCELLNVKVLGDSGSGSDVGIAAGIDYAIERKAKVISGSLGSGQPSQRIIEAVNRALKANIICIFAAGNDGPREGTVGWPGAMEGVVCVAATDKGNVVASFSSRGRQIEIAAPGVQIDSTYPGGRYALLSGTSMATPYVSGIAALYAERCEKAGIKDYNTASFMKAIEATATDLAPTGRDTATGFGLINPVALLESVKADKPVDPIPPPAKGFTGQLIYKDGMLVEIRK
jgi:subtilisin